MSDMKIRNVAALGPVMLLPQETSSVMFRPMNCRVRKKSGLPICRASGLSTVTGML